jgi:acetylornithine deacetylase/succinyl-diaminopimelate desuccinylase-like protein
MKDWIDTYWESDALPTLIEFGRIPNVSQAYAPTWSEDGHMDRAAELLKNWAESRTIRGMTVELLRADMRSPLLFIEIPGDTDETVLMYGHLDKQPPMLPWREGLDPWNPVREGDLLYGRGLADDGYSTFAALGAVEAALAAGHKIPRVCIIIEAGEESGSPDLRQYVHELKSRIGSPAVVITLDSEDRDGGRLWLTQSLRGIVNGFLKIDTIPGTMHSGLASGVVPSAMRIFRLVLAKLENPETGHIIDPRVSPPLTDAMRAFAATIAHDIPDFLESYDLPPGLSAAAETLPELVANSVARAALEVTGITGLPEARGAGNVTVGSITARLSIRIPPGVDPDTASQAVQETLEQDPPYGARVRFEPLSADWGWMARPYSPEMEARVAQVSDEVYGVAPGRIGLGVSIPFVQIMVQEFPHAEHILTGVLSQSSHAHGPNENMSIHKVKRLTEFVATFLASTR